MSTPDNAALDKMTEAQLRAVIAWLERQLAHEQARLRWLLEEQENRT